MINPAEECVGLYDGLEELCVKLGGEAGEGELSGHRVAASSSQRIRVVVEVVRF